MSTSNLTDIAKPVSAPSVNKKSLRSLFLILEITLIVSALCFYILASKWWPDSHNIIVIMNIFGVISAVPTIILLFGSPWFVKSLGRIALIGWLLAIANFLAALLLLTV